MNKNDIKLAAEWWRRDIDNFQSAEDLSDDDKELVIEVLAENDFLNYLLVQHDEGNENVTIHDYRAYCKERENEI